MKCINLNAFIILLIISISLCSDSRNKITTNNSNKSNTNNISTNLLKNKSQTNTNTNSSTNSQSKNNMEYKASSNSENSRKLKFEDFFENQIYEINDKFVNKLSEKNSENSQNEDNSFLTKNQKKIKSNEESRNKLLMDFDDYFGETENIKDENELNNFFQLEETKGKKKAKDPKGENKFNGKSSKGKKILKFKMTIDNKNSYLNKLRENLKNQKNQNNQKNKKNINQEKSIISLEKKINKFSKCKIKSGILLEYKGIKVNYKTFTYEAHMKTAYVELSKESINLKSNITSEKNIKTAGVYKILRLKKILRISQEKKLKKYACFDLIYLKNDKNSIENKLILCAEDQKNMKSWINAIQEFKECQIKIQKINNNEQLVYDFSKINYLLKQKEQINFNPKTQIIKGESKLYYTNTPVKIKRPNNKDSKLKNVANKILDNFRIMNIKEDQVKRKYAIRVKTAKKFRKNMEKKVDSVKRNVEEKIRKEKMKNLEKILNKDKQRELELLKAAENRLRLMRKSQIVEIEKKFKRKYDNELKKAKKKSTKIMKIIINSKKLSNYKECYDPRLNNYKDNIYSEGVCKRIFGEHVRLFLIF